MPGQEQTRRTIGPVEIIRHLGGGGMGDVYEGTHTRLEIPVVVKVIRPELTSDRGLVKRFLQEARLAASLRHPNIVRVYDVDLHDTVPFFVMELLEGVSLDAILVKQGRMQPARALAVAVQVADALGHAHQRGVIHRDVKPDNIMVDARWHAVLTDFGLAVLRRARLRLTEPGTPVGTPHYASPEQLSGRAGVDGRSDLYSLGVVLFELLTGQLPFPETRGMDGVLSRIDAEPPSMKPLLSWIPEELDTLIQRVLAPHPENRPSSAEEFATELRRMQDLPGLADPKDAEARVLPGGDWGGVSQLPRGRTNGETAGTLRLVLPREADGLLLANSPLSKFDLNALLRSFAAATRNRAGYMLLTYPESSDLVLYEAGRPMGCFRFEGQRVLSVRGRHVLQHAEANREAWVSCHAVTPELLRVFRTAFSQEPLLKNLRGAFIRFEGLVEELSSQMLDGFVRLRTGNAYSFLLYSKGRPSTAYLAGELLTSCQRDPHREIAHLIEHAALPITIDVYEYPAEEPTVTAPAGTVPPPNDPT